MTFALMHRFEQGLANARRHHTAQSLGDRAAYIGASDIGQCPRKAVLAKTTPKTPDLATLIRFERGHIAEEIVAIALRDASPDRQVELEAYIPYCRHCRYWSQQPATGPVHCPECGEPLCLLPLKAHCDFVFGDELVLECKSAQGKKIQDSWKVQLQTQLFLYEHCRQHRPQGCILVMDLARGALKITDPCPLDMDMIPGIIESAATIWEGVAKATAAPDPEGISDIETKPGPLCGYCGYLKTCPVFCGEPLADEIAGLFREYHETCKSEKDAKAKKDALRDQVLAMLAPGKYMAGDFRVTLSERSRTITDTKAIAAILGELGQNIADYQRQTFYKALDVKAA